MNFIAQFLGRFLYAKKTLFCSYVVCLSRPYSFKFFKGCLSQILLGPFLNTLSLMASLENEFFGLVTSLTLF